MYVARFQTSDGAWIQVAAELRFAAPAASSHTAAWWDEAAAQLAAASRIENATVARRITVDAERRLRQIIAITAPEASEADVRSVFAGLTRLERLFGGSINLAASRDMHDRLLGDVPSLQFSTSDEKYWADGLQLACDCRISPALDDLLAEAALAGRSITYQVHARGYSAEPETIRAARKNALSVSSTEGARKSLVNAQEVLAGALASASALAEEFLAVDSEAGARVAASLLHERFRSQATSLGIALKPPRFASKAHEDDLTHAVHRVDLELLSPVDLASSGVSASQRDAVLAWRPSPRLEALLKRDPGPPGDSEDQDPQPIPPPVASGLPVPFEGRSRFAFVSYKRQDLERIAPIMRAVVDAGTPIWFDRGIPGGAEWDAVIEERLSRCALVLLCASQAALASKYVRREVKYADTKDTPLLTVLLEDARLTDGLDMLLTQYQMLDSRAPDFRERLHSSLRTKN